jgi:LPXTG-motif cell wall-anchored protein
MPLRLIYLGADMPQTGMDWWIIAGVIVALVGVGVAFLRRPTKTVNEITKGDGNTQSGGAGSTHNKIVEGNKNKQSG